MAVLITRLYKPVVKQQYILRQEILNYLDNHADNPMVLVIAGAGYGKSVTISQWLDHHPTKYGWISLDEDCNDLQIFLAYLLTCVRNVFPKALPQFADVIDTLELPPVKEISDMLINEIVKLDEEFAIVFDDYHMITNPQIHELINGVIMYPPEKLKIFFLSRHDPPLKLSSLRAYDLVSELRMSDLKFSPSEIVSLSEKLNPFKIMPEIAEEVYQSTEGWIIGIRLILKEFSEGKNVLGSLKAIRGNKDNLSRFMMDEILADQSETIQKFLALSSLFDRFDVGLLEFINQKNNEFTLNWPQTEKEIMKFIENSMFIIPLDSNSTWHRFHHLIQDFLKELALKRFSRDQIDSFYLSASEYFENSSFLEEAISCAIEGHNISNAIRIMVDHWQEHLLRDHYSTIERWIGMLPAGIAESNTNLLVFRTILNDAQANYPEMKQNLDKLEAMLKPLDIDSNQSRILWGEYHALRTGLNYFTGNIAHVTEHADQAIELLSVTRSYFQDYAILFKAFALHISGKNEEAIHLFKEHQISIPPDYRLGLMRSHSFLPLIHIYQADLDALKSSAKLAHQISKEEKAWVSHVMANYFLGSVNYLQNNLDKAEPYINSVAVNRLAGRPMWIAHTLFFGVLNYLSSGQFEKMKQAADDVVSFLKSFNIDNCDDLAYSFQVELALRLNNLELAEKYAAKTRYNSIPIIFSFYFTQLTEVKLLMKKGDSFSMNRALELLENYAEYGIATHNRNFLLQVYTLLAFWHKNTNHQEEAVRFLKEALDIGRPGRYIRMFADYGEEMRELLMLLPKIDLSNRFVSNILRVIDEDTLRIKPAMISNETTKKTDDLNQLLTARESEILELVGQGFQNKEIADRLFLSLETINKYLYYAYQKLGVKNRSGAVARAKQLNLID